MPEARRARRWPRLLLALALVGGSVGAVVWAHATRDLRAFRERLDEVEADLAIEEIPEARPPLRNPITDPATVTAVEAELRRAVREFAESKGDAARRPALVAAVRSAIACDHVTLRVASEDPNLEWIARGMATERHADELAPPVERVHRVLDDWRFQHDLWRVATTGEIVEIGRSRDPCLFPRFDDVVDLLDRPTCDDARRELTLLLETRPSVRRLISRSRLVHLRARLRRHGADMSADDARMTLAEVKVLEAIYDRKQRRANLLFVPTVESEGLAIESTDAWDDTNWNGTQTCEPAIQALANDVAQLQVARLATLARAFRLDHGRWPRDRVDLLGAAAAREVASDPDSAISLIENSTGTLSVSCAGRAYPVITLVRPR